MKAVFVETSEFTEWVSEHLTDDLYSSLQQELMDSTVTLELTKRLTLDPGQNRVIPGRLNPDAIRKPGGKGV